MKKIILIISVFALMSSFNQAPVYNKAYVTQLFSKYPTHKSQQFSNGVVWVNPYYKSIADVQNHYPIVEHYVYTLAHRLQQERNMDTLKIYARKGIYAEWNPGPGFPPVDDAYTEANKEIGKTGTSFEISYGHCGAAWILLAYTQDGAFFSDTEDFNEGMEYQGQNTGTEEATEDRCRTLTGWKKAPIVTQSIDIWAGCYGNQGHYTGPKSKITVTVPQYFWKVIKYNGVTECWWMPNLVTETKDKLSKAVIPFADLVKKLGFDPLNVKEVQ